MNSNKSKIKFYDLKSFYESLILFTLLFKKVLTHFLLFPKIIDTLISGLSLKTVILFNSVLENKLQ